MNPFDLGDLSQPVRFVLPGNGSGEKREGGPIAYRVAESVDRVPPKSHICISQIE